MISRILSKLVSLFEFSFIVDGVKITFDFGFTIMFILLALLTDATTLAVFVALYSFILLHELGHVLVAKVNGFETHKIVIYPFGAGAFISNLESARPRQELDIALAGPLVNIFFFGLFGVLCALGFPFHSVMWMNLGLALFNFLPIYPMDGGRIFKSLIRIYKPNTTRLQATRWAVGVACGMLAILLPASFFILDVVGLINFIIIAAVVLLAGQAEISALKGRED